MPRYTFINDRSTGSFHLRTLDTINIIKNPIKKCENKFLTFWTSKPKMLLMALPHQWPSRKHQETASKLRHTISESESI